MPEVTWKLNGEVLKQTSRKSTTTDALQTAITIRECTLADSGVYSITASNSSGTQTGNCSKIIYSFSIFYLTPNLPPSLYSILIFAYMYNIYVMFN